MRLNGWQRLWIFLSVVWIAAVFAVAIISRQSKEERYHKWCDELIEYLITQSPNLRGLTLTSVRAAYSDMSDKQLIDALHDKYLVKNPAYRYGFSEIDAKYRSGAASLLKSNLDWVLAALGVPLAMYLLGAAAAWVRAGFKHP